MSNLTPKQEKFVQALIAGKSQREAYKEAYNATRMKDATIDSKAYLLFNKDYIRARYNELLEEHKNKALYTREEAVNDLIWIKNEAKTDISNKGMRQANSNTFIGAVKELCTLEDLYPKNNKYDEKIEKDIAKVLKEAFEDI